MSAKGIGYLLLCVVGVAYASYCAAQMIAGREKERMWEDRVRRHLVSGMTEADSEATLRSWGLSPLKHELPREITAFIGVNVRYLFTDYSLRIVTTFDTSGRLVSAKVERVYSAPL